MSTAKKVKDPKSKQSKKDKSTSSASPADTINDTTTTTTTASKDEEPPLINAEIYSSGDLKNHLDDQLKKYLAEEEFTVWHRISNIKLSLMFVACAFGLFAQIEGFNTAYLLAIFNRFNIHSVRGYDLKEMFDSLPTYPFDRFPSANGKLILGVCCGVYFFCSSVLTMYITLVESDIILQTQKRTSKESPYFGHTDDLDEKTSITRPYLRVRTNQGKYDDKYKVSFEGDASIYPPSPSSALTAAALPTATFLQKILGQSPFRPINPTISREMEFYVGDYFTNTGVFDTLAFEVDLEFELKLWLLDVREEHYSIGKKTN
jgi:hypothetical protein